MRRILGLLTILFLSVAVSPAQEKVQEGLRCSLTKKKIDKCCCEQKDGKLYCPLAKKTIEKCCCGHDHKASEQAPKKK